MRPVSSIGKGSGVKSQYLGAEDYFEHLERRVRAFFTAGHPRGPGA